MSAPENEELKGANWHILFCHIELELWSALPDVREAGCPPSDSARWS